MLFCVIPVLGGCKLAEKLEGRLGEHETANSRLTLDLARDVSGRDIEALDWKTALELLNERNISLRQGRTRIAEIAKERDEQWKTWLPRVGVYGSLFSSLSELGNLAFGSPSFSVIAPLNIPNPLTERARAYQNALTYLQAVDNQKLTYRRLVTRLYVLYSNAENLEERMKSEPVRDGTGVNAGFRRLEATASLREEIRLISGQMAQLLNLPGQNPFPAVGTRPEVDYSGRISKLVPGKNHGELAVRLTAYQIEAALLREKGIKLKRWPTFSLSAGSPALYDNRSEEGSGYLDADQITLYGGVGKSYDFTGAETQGVESAEENTKFVRENLRLSLDQEAREWERLRTRYRELQNRQEVARQRLERIRKPGAGGSAMTGLEGVREVSATLDAARQMKERLDLEIWVWDERAWK